MDYELKRIINRLMIVFAIIILIAGALVGFPIMLIGYFFLFLFYLGLRIIFWIFD